MARREWNLPKRIYAAYRGDEYIGEGTIAEIAAMAGVSYATHESAMRCGRESDRRAY